MTEAQTPGAWRVELCRAAPSAHLWTRASKLLCNSSCLACSATSCCRTAASRLCNRRKVEHTIMFASWKVYLVNLCSTALFRI